MCTYRAIKKALRLRDICRRLRELTTPTTEQSLTSLSYLPFIQMSSFLLLLWFSQPNIFLSESRISHKPTLLRGRSIFHPSRCQGFDWNTNLICVKRQVAFLLLCQNKGEQMIMSIDIKNIKMIIIFMMKFEETCRCSSSTGRSLLAQETPQHCWQAGQDCILVL